MITDYYGYIFTMFVLAFFQHCQRLFQFDHQLDHKAVFVDRASDWTCVNEFVGFHV